MKIWLTGAAGFVGSHLAKALVEEGHEVVGIVRSFGSARAKRLLKDFTGQPNARLIEVDLEDTVSLAQHFHEEPIDLLIHCASQQPRREINFDAYFRGNVLLLNHLLDQMKEGRTRMIIAFSTVVVYGNTLLKSLSEENSENPSNEYGLSKWMGDQVLQYRTQEAGWNCVTLRMPSLFGPDQEGGLVDAYYRSVLRGEKIEIYSEGKLYRNLLHIDDVVRVCQLVIQKIETLKGYHLFLLGSRNSLTMEQIAHYMIKRMHSGSSIKLVSRRAPVEAHWNLSLNKTAKQLNFHPMTIEEGIDRYLDQMRNLGKNGGRAQLG